MYAPLTLERRDRVLRVGPSEEGPREKDGLRAGLGSGIAVSVVGFRNRRRRKKERNKYRHQQELGCPGLVS